MVAVETEAAPSNQQPESGMFEWLSEIGLSGYASALESNGFDDLWFLVCGTVLFTALIAVFVNLTSVVP